MPKNSNKLLKNQNKKKRGGVVMYNHNNNGKYLIHYGRKGMKWGQHIFTQDDALGGLFRRKKNARGRSKKVDDMARSGKYKVTEERDGSRKLSFSNKFKDNKDRIINILNEIDRVDDLSDRDLDKAISTINDSRGNARRLSGLVRGLNNAYNRNDISFDPDNISQFYSMTDAGPMITITTGNVDGRGHYGSGVYYVNTGEFGKNDFVIDG